MKTIWKYPLEIVNSQTLEVPQGCKFLSVAEQNGALVLYALVDPSAKLEKTEVLIRGTGHPIDEGKLLSNEFIGSVVSAGGMLVWHVFVEGRKT